MQVTATVAVLPASTSRLTVRVRPVSGVMTALAGAAVHSAAGMGDLEPARHRRSLGAAGRRGRVLQAPNHNRRQDPGGHGEDIVADGARVVSGGLDGVVARGELEVGEPRVEPVGAISGADIVVAA